MWQGPPHRLQRPTSEMCQGPEVTGLSGARAQVGALVDAQEMDAVTLAAAFGHLAKLSKAAGSGGAVSDIPRQLKRAPPHYRTRHLIARSAISCAACPDGLLLCADCSGRCYARGTEHSSCRCTAMPAAAAACSSGRRSGFR